MNHPALLDQLGVLSFRVLKALHQTHEGNVVGRRITRTMGKQNFSTTFDRTDEQEIGW